MEDRSAFEILKDMADSITPPKKKQKNGLEQLQDLVDSITPPKNTKRKRTSNVQAQDNDRNNSITESANNMTDEANNLEVIREMTENLAKKQRSDYEIEREPDQTYAIETRGTKSFKGKVIKETTFSVEFLQQWQGKQLKNLKKELTTVFQDVLDHGSKDFDDQDIARMYITHKSLNKPIIVTPRALKYINPKIIMEAVENVLQSEETLSIEEGFSVQLGVAKIEKGAGNGRPVTNVHRDRIAKRSIVSINNDDNLCLARAISVGIARNEVDGATNDQSKRMAMKKYKQIRQGTHSTHQRVKALQYHQQAKIPTDRPCALTDIPAFEQVLDTHLGNKVIYQGPVKNSRVYLYFTKTSEEIGHFDTIVNIKGLLCKAFFCHKCLKGFQDKHKHSCEVFCRVCRFGNCPETATQLCDDCNMTCRSAECFARHKKHCSKYWMCPTCKHVLDLQKRKAEYHKCGEWLCNACQKYHVGEHLCYLRIQEPKKPIDKFIFFDFEANQESGEHKANFVIAQSVCSICEDQETDRCFTCGSRCPQCWKQSKEGFAHLPCDQCAFKEVKFEGGSTAEKFGEWLFHSQHKGCTVVAHNAKSYDSYFLLDYLTNNSVVPEIIYNGSKIMYMNIKKLDIRVLDSLNFLPMKLAALPRSFGITELKKGYFPHFFNTEENQNYVGPFPAPKYYGVSTMMKEDREKFLNWHTQQSGKLFNFRQELEEYCRSDVDILRKACLKFRQLMLETTGLDPFTSVTIASVCMSVFRCNFLKEKWEYTQPDGSKIPTTKQNNRFSPAIQGSKPSFIQSNIGKIPAAGYTGRDNFSRDSIYWLEWEAKKRGMHIQHALNGGEVKIPNGKGGFYKLDGVNGNMAFEYNGCVWHGCSDCFKDSEDLRHPYNKQTLAQRYALTVQKRIYLESIGYKVVTKWEHEFQSDVQSNQELRDFINTVNIQPRLDPRDSFFGGRTNAAKLYYKAQEGERLQYVDFTSLYPTVNKYDRYPVGHPVIITENFARLDQYFGIVKTTILPPRTLYHPVLPMKCHGKLMFPLCRTCAENKSSSCQCSDEERMITGTWTTIEVLKALEKGYEVQKIHEIYHFPETTKYDHATKQGGLFTEYVNKFLKLKQEASGWPDWCKTEEDKLQYITNYKEREGIQLEYTNIVKNPGLRSLAKLMLNSFWGKFGQRQNMRQSKVITDEAEFFQAMSDPTRKLTDWHVLNDNMVQLEWEYSEGFIPEDLTTNIFLATFTTAHARLRLYNVLEKLGHRVCYYDTDSVIYISRPDEYDPPLGDYLGDLTDEIDGHFITEFVSAGPKNYSYRLDNNKTFCKVKGLSLNYTNSAKINFDVMKSEVFSNNDPIFTTANKICRDKIGHRLYNREEKKKYQMVYDKRCILPNMDTVPYGY